MAKETEISHSIGLVAREGLYVFFMVRFVCRRVCQTLSVELVADV